MADFNRDTRGVEVVQAFADRVAGKTVVITGASVDGLGAQAALEVAGGKAATIVLLARDAGKVQPVIDQISKINASIKVVFVQIKLDDLDSVRAAASAVASQLVSAKIDVLINNAGIMCKPYAKTVDGIESHFAINHLGHFVLTQRLIPLLRKAGPTARVVNVTSNGYLVAPFDPEDVNFTNGRPYHPWSGYGQSKTATMLFTKALAKRGVLSFAPHPGVITTTHLGDGLDYSLFGEIDAVTKQNTGREFGSFDAYKDVQQGVATVLVAALDPRVEEHNGAYLRDCKVVDAADVAEYARNDDMVEKLWSLSEELSGEKFEI